MLLASLCKLQLLSTAYAGVEGSLQQRYSDFECRVRLSVLPRFAHGFLTRCDPRDPKQKKGMERAKNAAVRWFAQILHLH